MKKKNNLHYICNKFFNSIIFFVGLSSWGLADSHQDGKVTIYTGDTSGGRGAQLHSNFRTGPRTYVLTQTYDSFPEINYYKSNPKVVSATLWVNWLELQIVGIHNDWRTGGFKFNTPYYGSYSSWSIVWSPPEIPMPTGIIKISKSTSSTGTFSITAKIN